MGIRDFLRRLAGREPAGGDAPPEPERPGPLASLELSEPLDVGSLPLQTLVRGEQLAAGPLQISPEPVPLGERLGRPALRVGAGRLHVGQLASRVATDSDRLVLDVP